MIILVLLLSCSIMDAEELYKKTSEFIKDVIKKELPADVNVYLIGSRAKGDYTHCSDIDLALDSEKLDRADLIKLKNIIDDSFVPYHIDMIDLKKTNKDFREYAMKGAIKWI